MLRQCNAGASWARRRQLWLAADSEAVQSATRACGPRKRRRGRLQPTTARAHGRQLQRCTCTRTPSAPAAAGSTAAPADSASSAPPPIATAIYECDAEWLDLDDFAQAFLEPSQPVVLRGLAAAWPALRNWPVSPRLLQARAAAAVKGHAHALAHLCGRPAAATVMSATAAVPSSRATGSVSVPVVHCPAAIQRRLSAALGGGALFRRPTAGHLEQLCGAEHPVLCERNGSVEPHKAGESAKLGEGLRSQVNLRGWVCAS